MCTFERFCVNTAYKHTQIMPVINSLQVLTAPGDQVDKVVQLYEVMLTRHTTMVVGQTGGGKSVILQTLARAQV